MEEIINKPDNQFKDILNDLIDYTKDSEEKSALIKEVCLARRQTKPAPSLNSSIYSSVASSSSSTSSASDSSTNSASSSSTSSTLSSPSQSTNQANNDANTSGQELDNIEVAKMEDLGKTARFLEHRLAISNELTTATNGAGIVAASSTHSDKRSTSLNGKSSIPSSLSSLSQNTAYHSTQQQANSAHQSNMNSTLDNTTWNFDNWKQIGGKRDKRRKKPTEQPVLSQHIPGHKGEQEVEWLVKFIESGANSINTSSNKKITKNTKQQSRRQPSQTTEHDRENHQRKSNNSKPIAIHIKPLHQQTKQMSSSDTTVPSVQSQHADQRKVQAISIDDQPQQSLKQQSLQERSNDRSNECKETNIRLKSKRDHDHKKEEVKRDEAVVTFADHIRVSDDEVRGRYIFGFFDEQRQQASNQSKSNKTTTTTTNTTMTTTTMKHNENSPVNNTKLNQVGQKHKLKHPKASPNSEQKRNKFNDNIDANSFNYHQIVEFISKQWSDVTRCA